VPAFRTAFNGARIANNKRRVRIGLSPELEIMALVCAAAFLSGYPAAAVNSGRSTTALLIVAFATA
jgi:hypothetical protein